MTYNEFIQNIINTRGQWNIPKNKYFEIHHIKPICLGGLPKREEMTNTLKFSKHENLIWLYPEEHFLAHKLLFLENPTNYGLAAAWLGTSKNNQLSVDDYAELKNKTRLPDNILQIINENGAFHYRTNKSTAPKTTRRHKTDEAKYAHANYGNKNGMYNNGNKISGGKNGHASITYFYDGLQFDCRKSLQEYLHSIDVFITDSAIRKVVHNTGTNRVYQMYKQVFDKLTWRYKNEN